MITEQDLEFHHSAGDDYTWAETYYLPISVPTQRLFAHVYVCVRPVLGCMSNDIRVMGSVSDTEFDLLHINSHFHLPAPERFSHITGPNGLSVRAVRPPRDYRIDYVGSDGTEIHVDLTGIMDPFDIHDPQHNPMAGTTDAERLARTSMGSGYKGHFDMHCRSRGTLTVRGTTYEVDIVDRMNHSWGPRPEMAIPPMNSMWAQFGEERGFRMHLHMNPAEPTGQDQHFAHGYMLDGGEVLALTGALASTTRLGIVPISTELEMTDSRGRTHRLHGVPLCGAPWRAYSTSVTWCGLMQWEYEGRIGHGSFQENRSLVVETGLRGRRWTDPVPALTG